MKVNPRMAFFSATPRTPEFVPQKILEGWWRDAFLVRVVWLKALGADQAEVIAACGSSVLPWVEPNGTPLEVHSQHARLFTRVPPHAGAAHPNHC